MSCGVLRWGSSKTVSFDVPSDADVAREEVEHQQPSKDFCIVVFVGTEEALATVGVFHYFFLLLLGFLAF